MKITEILRSLGIVFFLLQCHTKTTTMIHSFEEVRTIFRKDKQMIIETYSAIGAGIGKEEERYIIVVYVNDKSKEKIQETYWKAIPVRFKYTGEIKVQ